MFDIYSLKILVNRPISVNYLEDVTIMTARLENLLFFVKYKNKPLGRLGKLFSGDISLKTFMLSGIMFVYVCLNIYFILFFLEQFYVHRQRRRHRDFL